MVSFFSAVRKRLWVVHEKDFEELLKDGFEYSIMYFAIILAVFTVFFFIMESVAQYGELGYFDNLFVAQVTIIVAVLQVILTVGAYPAMSHLLAGFFGSKRPLTDSIQMYIYGGTPYFLFGWLPCINIISGLVGFGNIFRGLREIHKLSLLQAVVVSVVPQIVAALVLALMLLALDAFLVSFGY